MRNSQPHRTVLPNTANSAAIPRDTFLSRVTRRWSPLGTASEPPGIPIDSSSIALQPAAGNAPGEACISATQLLPAANSAVSRGAARGELREGGAEHAGGVR